MKKYSDMRDFRSLEAILQLADTEPVEIVRPDGVTIVVISKAQYVRGRNAALLFEIDRIIKGLTLNRTVSHVKGSLSDKGTNNGR